MINEHTKKEIEERFRDKFTKGNPVGGISESWIFRDGHKKLADALFDFFLSEYASLDASRVELVRRMLKPHDPDDEVSKWYFEKKGYNDAVKSVLTNVFNEKK